MRVVQVSSYIDPLARSPEQLLAAWPALVDVAVAAARTDVEVCVVQAARVDAQIRRDGVTFRFVTERPVTKVRRQLGHWAFPLPHNSTRQLAELRPDVIHFHGLSFPLHVRYLRRHLHVPLLVQDHADRVPPRWRRALSRHGLAAVSGAAFTVHSQAERFIEAGVLPASALIFEVLESSSHFTPGDMSEARAATGLRGDPCLLWLGHLDANKDPLTILAALSRIAAQLPDPHLWCCYLTAPLLAQVRGRIDRDAQLRGRVHLLGRRPHSEVERLLRAADFLVQGSHREGSGYAVIEALACGTTPLVTDIPSFRRITGGGTFGALSPPGDVAAMSDALLRWSRRDRQHLRRAARAHFEATLSFDALGRELRTAYEALVARG